MNFFLGRTSCLDTQEALPLPTYNPPSYVPPFVHTPQPFFTYSKCSSDQCLLIASLITTMMHTNQVMKVKITSLKVTVASSVATETTPSEAHYTPKG